MKLTTRGSVYVADLREEGLGRHSLRTKDKAEASAKMRDLYVKLSSVEAVGQRARAVPTLGNGYRDCLTQGAWKGVKDKRSIETRWKTVKQFFPEGTPMADITIKPLKKFCEWMTAQVDRNGDQRFSPKTIHRHLSLISAILRNAAEDEVIDAMPIIPWPKGSSAKGGRIRWYTREEESQIIAWFLASDWPEMASLAEFLLDSGFRRNEAIGDYRVVDGCAVLDDQKSGKQTMTPLTQRALVAAKAKPWKGLTASVLNKRWEKMRDGLGLGSGANLHACRHTTATRLAMAGEPLQSIQKFMRHGSETVTLIYIHLAEQARASAVDVLEKRK